jgi:hypothetical protein
MKENRFTQKCSGMRSIPKGVFVTVILIGLFACALPGIKQSAIKPNEVMNFADQNYDKFVITYCGEKDSPTAIRFDSKSDDVTLTGDGWHPVESKAQLNGIIEDLTAKSRRYNEFYRGPYLFEIQSGEGRTIGYLYCLLVELTIRKEGTNYWMRPVTEADLKDERKLYSVKGAGG